MTKSLERCVETRISATSAGYRTTVDRYVGGKLFAAPGLSSRHGTSFGHTLETQFPLGLALAALSISRGALFPPNDPTGLEVEMSKPPTQIVVMGAGHWQGEGMALVEAIK